MSTVYISIHRGINRRCIANKVYGNLNSASRCHQFIDQNSVLSPGNDSLVALGMNFLDFVTLSHFLSFLFAKEQPSPVLIPQASRSLGIKFFFLSLDCLRAFWLKLTHFVRAI